MKRTSRTTAQRLPTTPANARNTLERGNADFVQLLDQAAAAQARTLPLLTVETASFGLGRAPVQSPFAAVLGCADARVPVEIIFQKGCNDLFVVRVAGNVVTNEGLGSFDFAAKQFSSSLRLAIVLGHTRCGAVTAAVDAFVSPADYFTPSQPLRSVLDHLFIAVRTADRDLRRVYGADVVKHPGYRTALIESSVILNAAMSALTLRQELDGGCNRRLQVVFGVYDLGTCRVSAPSIPRSPKSRSDETAFLAAPPNSPAAFAAFGQNVASLPRIAAILHKPHRSGSELEAHSAKSSRAW